MTLEKKEVNEEDKNKELMKEIKVIAVKYNILGFWVATPETCADYFMDDATMYRFISTAHEVENAYTSIKEEKALGRKSEYNPKKKDFSGGDDYFG